MNELTHLGQRFGTDKAFHHKYTDVYQVLFEPFRYEKIDFMEIGLLEYASIKMWQAYFTQARIFGIDIALYHPIPDFKFGTSSVRLIECDGADPQLLQRLPDDFHPRVVIDDGSHRSADHITSLKMLYPLVESGGYYIIEDTHCQHPKKAYKWGHLNKGINSLEWLKQQTDIPQHAISYHPSMGLGVQKFAPSLVVIKKP